MLGVGVLEGNRVGICAGGGPLGVGVLAIDLSGRCVGCGVLGVGILAGSHGCKCSDVGVSVVVVKTSSPSSTQAGIGSVGVQVLAGNLPEHVPVLGSGGGGYWSVVVPVLGF